VLGLSTATAVVVAAFTAVVDAHSRPRCHHPRPRTHLALAALALASSAASTTSLPSSRLHRRLSSSPAPAPLLSAPMSMGRGSPPPAFNFTQTQRSDHILKHVGCSNNVSRVRHRRGFVSRRSHIKSQVHLHLKQGVLCLSAQETLPVVGLHVDHRCWGVASVNQGTSALTLQKDGLIFASCVGLILAMRIEPAGCLHRDILPLLK